MDKKETVATPPAPKEVPLEKAYEPRGVEGGIYAAWEASGFFNPDKLPESLTAADGKPFTVMMPPPNRTGILHMGHATGIAVQDLLTRFQRMNGRRALWLPGTDHAAIATQVKVEDVLRKEGMANPRAELGREKFLERVVAFAEESGATILQQTRSMGASCDWDRLAYTFDEPRNRAVNEMFKRMFEDRIIERGYRVVNWDPQFRTTLSDDEVETKETTARFLTFKYDKDFPIVISTTRPETKFGDTAVAVHPDDARYKEFVGQTFTPTFCGKRLEVRVIADAAVDPTFGTGALGVTPAHSMIDSEMADRHGLPMVQVIGEDGRMTDGAGKDFAGLTVVEARKKIEQMLADAGLLEKVDEIAQNLPVAQRGGAPVEQLPMKQWFIRVNNPFVLRQDTLGKWKAGETATLKELMAHAVSSGQTKILPEQSEKVYFSWINNLRDWCISRQIWFGHRIPVWYHEDKCVPRAGQEHDVANCLVQVVSATEPRCAHCDAKYVQDPDTLDTWFSSGTWTFSTLGWPYQGEKPRDLAEFHPTDVLETGRDIIFFWVARMILMSTYALGEVPFRTVYLHGLVRDEQGRKMSKSLGNIIDPRDVAEKYGTDAVRLSLVFGTAPGADTRLGDEKIAYFRNFTNKLWNIARFALMNVDALRVMEQPPAPKTAADHWILSRLSKVIASVTADLKSYNISRPWETLRDFTWGELADWYLEVAKIEGDKDEMLSYVLLTVLKLWHPVMPYVTEAVFAKTFSKGEKDFLLVAPWPKTLGSESPSANETFDVVREIITAIRNLRATNGVEPGKRVDLVVAAGGRASFLNENAAVIKGLAKLENLTISADAAKPEGAASAVISGIQLYLRLAGVIDVEKEKARLAKELADAEKYAEAQARKLENADFVARAPEKVIAGEREKLAAAKDKAAKLKEQLASLS